MKIVYTDDAIADIEDVANFLRENYPAIAPAVRRRIMDVAERIARWPRSSRRVENERDVRVAPLIPYPYKLFYRIRPDTIEILHVHHAAREPWNEA